MAFPLDPQVGQDYTNGGKTWIWDGNKWILLSLNNTSVRKIGQLSDVEDENIQEKDGQLLAWDSDVKDADGNDGAWVRSDIDEVSSNVKILDDLEDVEIKESENKLGTPFGYYTQEDPSVDNGWGRYQVDVQNKTIEVHIRDLDGNTTEELLTADIDASIGLRFAYFDESWESSATLLKKTEFTGKSYIFTVREQEVVDRIYNGGVSKLFTVQSNEFRGLAHNTVLTYKVDPDSGESKWRPAFMAGAGGNANITLSTNPPPEPDFDDMWIDASNYYMYVWTRVGNPDLQRGSWVAVTGPGGVDGGSDLVNDSTVTILDSRGFNVQSGRTFSLNQPKNHLIQMSPSSTVELDGAPPASDERLKSDIWVDTKDYKMYIWNDVEWVGLTGDTKSEGAAGAGFNYIPCEMDGGRADTEFCLDDGFNIDGGRAQQVYCENDDIYAGQRPGAIVGPDAPAIPKKGDMWFDTSLLELRVWYVSEASHGRWVSALNPNMDPPLPPDPNPDPIRIDGPNSAVAGIASDTFTSVIGHNLLSPFFSWSSTDADAYIQKIGGSLNTVQMVFSTPGTHRVSCTVVAANLEEPIADTLRVVVAETPDNVPVVYDVLVRFFSGSEVEGTKSGNKFVVNGKRQPYITFVRGKKYIFTQSDSSNYNRPLTFFRDEARKIPYTEGVLLGTDYTEIQVPADGPKVIYYDTTEDEDIIGNICYLAGEYQDPNVGDEVFLPLVTTRHYNFTEPTELDSPPLGSGEFFAWHSNWSVPFEGNNTYQKHDTWTEFYFNNLPDADQETAPNWAMILRSIERNGGGSREFTTIRVKDDTGKTYIYQVNKVVDNGDYFTVTVQFSSNIDIYDDLTIGDIEEKRMEVVITTPAALPGDEVISNP